MPRKKCPAGKYFNKAQGKCVPDPWYWEYRVYDSNYPHGQGHYLAHSKKSTAELKAKRLAKNLYGADGDYMLWKRDRKLTRKAKRFMKESEEGY